MSATVDDGTHLWLIFRVENQSSMAFFGLGGDGKFQQTNKSPEHLTLTRTEKLVQEINLLFKLTGDQELLFPKFASELELLQVVRAEYKRRLLDKVPQYKVLSSEALIPDMFIQALRNREGELLRDQPQ